MMLAESRRTELRQTQLRREMERRKRTAVGLVCPDRGLIKTIAKRGSWAETKAQPDIYLPAKMERVITTDKRFVIVLGGRGSGKSVSIADICIMRARDDRVRTYCLREYQSSIKNSVHSLLKAEITRFGMSGFDVQQNSIEYRDDVAFQFAGLARNVDSVKSAHGFGLYWVEEAQFLSAASLEALTPTARNMPKVGLPGDTTREIDDDGVSIIFVANQGSSQDPFSQRFIVPFQADLDRDGYYEDELHLIVVMNYTDNPWYADSGLEKERQFDFDKKPRAVYDHVWLGAYNDDVQNAIIPAEWFDACIDAHLKIKGWVPRGAKVTSHDPSDMGSDAKGLASRHGTVVTEAREIDVADVNDGCDEATGYAITYDSDVFVYDADGMGVSLRRQVNAALGEKKIRIVAYKGSEGVDRPLDVYQGKDEIADESKPRTNQETFRNKRSQKYWGLRDRCYLTYRAVVHGDYTNPDDMVSFASTISNLGKLRSELCRIPRRPNGAGFIQIMTKDEMRALKIPSPNLADAVYMLFGFEHETKVATVQKMTFRRAV